MTKPLGAIFFCIFFCTQLSLLIFVLANWIANPDSSWLSFVFLLITLAALASAAFYYRKNRFSLGKCLWDRGLALPLSLVVMGCFLRIYHLSRFSIWLDEDTQANKVFQAQDIIIAAASQQQPPTDYYFSWASLKVFGFTTWAVRLPALVFGCLFLYLFYCILYRLTESRKWSAIGLAFAALNPWLIWYAQEARPFSCSLFFFAIYLLFAIEFFTQKFQWVLFFNMAFASFFYLSTIGFQAPVFLLAFNLGVFIVYFCRQRGLTVRFHLANTLGLILFLPFQQLIKYNSAKYLKPFDWGATSSFSTMLNSKYLPTLYDLANLSRDNIIHAGNLLFFFLLVGFVFIFVLKKYRPHLLLPHFFYVFYISGFFFFLLGIFSFHFFINWHLSPRYLLPLVPIFILLSIMTFAFGEKCFAASDFRPRRFATWILFIVVSLALGNSIQQLTTTYKTRIYIYREDWRAVYNYLEKESNPDGAAFLISLRPSSEWTPSGFIAAKFYFTREMKKHLFLYDYYEHKTSSQADLLIDYLSRKLEPTRIFIIDDSLRWQNKSALQTISEIDQQIFRYKQFGQFAMLSIENTHGLDKTILKFLNLLEHALGQQNINFRTYEALTRFYLFKNNCKDATIYLNKYLAIIGDKYQPHDSPHVLQELHKAKCPP